MKLLLSKIRQVISRIRELPWKTTSSVAVLILFVFTLGVTVYISQKPKDIRKTAAQDQSPKPEYVPGEVLIKFKSQVPTLKVKGGEKNQGIDTEKAPVAFDDLEDQSLPPSLKDIHQKYKIEKIEKVFKGAEDPKKN